MIDESIQGAIDYFDNFVKKNKANFPVAGPDYEELKSIHDKSVQAKTIVSQFRKTGDLYLYLKSVTSKGNKVDTLFKKHKMKPFESIISRFETRYKKELSDCLEPSDLIANNIYSTWDVVFLARNYRTNTYGILTSRDPKGVINGIVVRGIFSDKKNYVNTWVNENECIYHLINGKNINNDNLLSSKYPVMVFETIGQNKQLFKGFFKKEEYLESKHSVRLTRIAPSGVSIPKKEIKKEYVLPTTKSFKKSADKRNAVKSGTAQSANAKRNKGRKSELEVIDFFVSLGFDVEDVANNPDYPYDLRINGIIGLEVKNISSGAFFISENEIRSFEKGKSRICFVDDKHILISKKYADTKCLPKIFGDIRKIDSDVIDNFAGKYAIDALKIGIQDLYVSELQKDFDDISDLNTLQIAKLLDIKNH